MLKSGPLGSKKKEKESLFVTKNSLYIYKYQSDYLYKLLTVHIQFSTLSLKQCLISV